MLQNFGTALSREQMKNVYGGVITTCSCTGSAGSWTYVSHGDIPAGVLAMDVADYCPSGTGSCSRTQEPKTA